jgi:uncharacterized protein (TIGR00255 family)
MPLRSMTGFAQVKSQVAKDGAHNEAAFTLSLKSVNHRYLDLHFRLPSESEALEIKLRQLLKEKLSRGHVDVSLSFDAASASGLALNRELVGGYIRAFQAAATEFGISGDPDLNVVLRMPGALGAAAVGLNQNGDLEAAVLAAAQQAIAKLDQMRAAEGATAEAELRERMAGLRAATEKVEKLRAHIVRAQMEKLEARLKELAGISADPNRVLQEAAVLAERSDVQEEVVRMKAHVQHFLDLLAAPGEVGKKLDFLLQEMNREANTMLSKTTGISGEGLRITELGLAMKSEIEKAREQVQNVE